MIYITTKTKKLLLIAILLSCYFLSRSSSVFAYLVIDEADSHFSVLVNDEVDKMESGKRGIVCQQLIETIKLSIATTTVVPITTDEKTWHPNDPKGTRSHVVALDTAVRGAKRINPTSAIIYLNINRIDPGGNLFKLGTFVELLAQAMTLNNGRFSADYKMRERQSMFYRNAWRDSMQLSLYPASGNVPTDDYRQAKKRGFITEQNKAYFPIINPENFTVPLSSPSHETR